MSPGVAFAVGVLAGIAVASLLVEPSDCCARVSRAVEEKVADNLGTGVAKVVGATGLYKIAPGLLNLFGVS